MDNKTIKTKEYAKCPFCGANWEEGGWTEHCPACQVRWSPENRFKRVLDGLNNTQGAL